MPENNPQSYLLNPQTGREYYGKALGINKEELWTDRPYESGYETSNPYLGRAMKVAGLAAGYAAMRSSPWAWDTAAQLARVGEDTLLPYRWGRTFQVSNILSHREAAVMAAQAGEGTYFNLAGDTGSASYIARSSHIPGLSPELVADKGVTFKQGKLYLGGKGGLSESAQVIGKHVGAVRTAEGGNVAFGKAWTKMFIPGWVGQEFNVSKFESASKVGGTTRKINRPTVEGMPIQFLIADSAGQYNLKRAGAIAAEFGVYRFNKLLSEDFTTHFATKWAADYLKEIPVLGKHFKYGLGVEAKGALSTFGRLTAKLGALGTVAPLAYQQADWMAERLLGMGITEGIATAGVAAHLGYAHALDFLEVPGIGDIYDLQEGLENWIPGLTNPYNLPKFALTGTIGGGLLVGAWERTRAFQRRGSSTGSNFWEKYSTSRAEQTKRYTDFIFESENKVGKFFERWGTAREGSVYASLKSGEPARGNWFSKWVANTFWSGHSVHAGSEGVLDLKFNIPIITEFFNKQLTFGRATTGKLASLAGAVAGAAIALPGLFGALVPDERPEELEDIYAGRQEVPIKRGRFWEFGRGSYEGDDIMYYRPHAFARMKAKARDRGIWGEDYDLSPIKKFFLREFTYDLEEKNYNSRPYPVTSLPFEDVPVIGPVLANTIGRLIKPPEYMHSEEWRQGEAVRVGQPGFGKSYATELGETPGGVPVSPYGVTQTISKAFYNLTEQAGLWGYALEGGIDALTGTPGVFDQYKVMSSFRDATSASRAFYDLNLGGMAMTNEAFRRLYPTERSYIDKYNPLRNEMPSWMPGAGDRGLDFKHGDPYTKVAEGEYRLPGDGYGGRFPELQGVDPEDYPLIHKFKILADVAPYSQQFSKISQEARKNRENFNEFDKSIYETTLQQLELKKQRKEFTEYRNFVFGEGDKYGAEGSSETLAAINRLNAAQQDTTTGFFGAVGSIYEFALHAQGFWDYLLPLSPEAKFNPRRTAIESYERENVYGTKSAFWNRPFDDFLSPAGKTLAHDLGWRGIPGKVEGVRDVQEYFDVLKYVKNTRLSNIAALNRDKEAEGIFEQRKDQTLFGMNPYTQNDSSIYSALPGADKPYFEAFSQADTPEKRQRILELVPRNQRELYIARWKLKQTQDMNKARDGMLNEMIQSNIIADRIGDTYAQAKDEGFPKDKELYQMYLHSKYQGETYSDWYRRTQLLPDVPLPGADWVGWHPSVDLEDIKLKVSMELGQDMHDHGFYDTQLRTMGGKPFLDAAVDELFDIPQSNSYQSRRIINDIFQSRRIQADIGISKQWGPGSRPQISLDLEQ